MMNTMLARSGAACGVIFAIALVLAAGDGGYSPARAVVSLAALTLAIPFICYLGRRLREAGPESAWLADTAVAAGVGGILVKITSAAPDLAIHRAHVAAGTSLHKVLTATADGATLFSLFPLAICCAATAVIALRTGVLPTWLAVGAALTAAALVVNGAFLTTSFVPALLLFMLWTALVSAYLTFAGDRVEGARPQRRVGHKVA
jgi:hypothetical protein